MFLLGTYLFVLFHRYTLYLYSSYCMYDTLLSQTVSFDFYWKIILIFLTVFLRYYCLVTYVRDGKLSKDRKNRRRNLWHRLQGMYYT